MKIITWKSSLWALSMSDSSVCVRNSRWFRKLRDNAHPEGNSIHPVLVLFLFHLICHYLALSLTERYGILISLTALAKEQYTCGLLRCGTGSMKRLRFGYVHLQGVNVLHMRRKIVLAIKSSGITEPDRINLKRVGIKDWDHFYIAAFSKVSKPLYQSLWKKHLQCNLQQTLSEMRI